jgi:transcription elongation factor GreA
VTKLPMTSSGFEILQNELKHREGERAQLIERIHEAIADDPDLAGNAAYQAAKAEQELNETCIAQLQDKLARAEIIDISAISGDVIRFGATVTLLDEDRGESKVWQLVGESEADAAKGKISITSPIGRALLGRRQGEVIDVRAPGGMKSYNVEKVDWLERPKPGQ